MHKVYAKTLQLTTQFFIQCCFICTDVNCLKNILDFAILHLHTPDLIVEANLTEAAPKEHHDQGFRWRRGEC